MQIKLPALRYHGGKRNNTAAKVQYIKWRSAQQPPLSLRCDNPLCRFHTEPLTWNGRTLPVILEHSNGVNTDNRPENLRLLCPNCDAQNTSTRGGANAGRVLKSEGGFALVDKQGRKHYFLPAEPGEFNLEGCPVILEKTRK